jgi:DNA-binding winged helix-turn-helix (wHTH) protein
MFEIGPEHPLTYRQEVTTQLFDLLRSGESCAVIGPASMGKSRLLQFLLRSDIQQHYLVDYISTWIVLNDCNRLADASEWGLYELMLTSLTEAASGRLNPSLRDWLNSLRREAITSGSALLARRHVELVTRILCREHKFRLCFIFDEFDEAYCNLPTNALTNLRALRDADRYKICYVLMLRDHPERLRPPSDNEGFYELVSRSVIGLKPYAEEDAHRVIAQLAARRHYAIKESQETNIIYLSGGHPGLMVALFDVLSNGENGSLSSDPVEWTLKQSQVVEECRKLWIGLKQDEQLALSRLAQGIDTSYSMRKLLTLKGLLQSISKDVVKFFSPVFFQYVLTQGSLSDRELWIDEMAAVVWVEGRRIDNLTRLEFELIRYMYSRLGQVCTRDEIISALYPGEILDPETIGVDNRVDSLVRHLRRAIEPLSGYPRYLLTVRGHGYKLVDKPETNLRR